MIGDLSQAEKKILVLQADLNRPQKFKEYMNFNLFINSVPEQILEIFFIALWTQSTDDQQNMLQRQKKKSRESHFLLETPSSCQG